MIPSHYSAPTVITYTAATVKKRKPIKTLESLKLLITSDAIKYYYDYDITVAFLTQICYDKLDNIIISLIINREKSRSCSMGIICYVIDAIFESIISSDLRARRAALTSDPVVRHDATAGDEHTRLRFVVTPRTLQGRQRFDVQ